MGARFSAPVQTGPGAHTASCTMGTGSFPGGGEGKERPGRDLGPSPPSSAVGHERVELYLYSLWAVRPVQSLSACTRGALYLYASGVEHLVCAKINSPFAYFRSVHNVVSIVTRAIRGSIPGRSKRLFML